MSSPSLRQLDIFAQMVAAGSAARCAQDLGLDLGEVLDGIAALEMRLGYRLFDDPAGAARLTPAGRKTAQAMMQLGSDTPSPADAAAAEAPDAPAPPPPAEPPREGIILAAPAPIFGHFQDALAAFEAANDDIAISIDLHVHSARDAAMALARGQANIAYFYALEEPAEPPSRYGWSEPLNLYAGSGHRLARAEMVGRDDIAATPLLAMEPHNGMRQIIDAALARARLPFDAPALESDNMFEIMAALRDGAGCFAAFGPLARDLGRMSGIRRLALDMPLPAIEIRQAVGADAARKPAVDALAEFLFL
ncbi:MAG: LysR family transcriptional regulator [Pseudomonadota bacterium]|uniref:LysR family transcriptional regulator n=1 Tax=Sphingobium naphthae TaxID=1886786 RepID=UPI002B1A24B8|nr:LysR family transcriptional regulator [Pseudomonadota bacterium]